MAIGPCDYRKMRKVSGESQFEENDGIILTVDTVYRRKVMCGRITTFTYNHLMLFIFTYFVLLSLTRASQLFRVLLCSVHHSHGVVLFCRVMGSS